MASLRKLKLNQNVSWLEFFEILRISLLCRMVFWKGQSDLLTPCHSAAICSQQQGQWHSEMKGLLQDCLERDIGKPNAHERTSCLRFVYNEGGSQLAPKTKQAALDRLGFH